MSDTTSPVEIIRVEPGTFEAIWSKGRRAFVADESEVRFGAGQNLLMYEERRGPTAVESELTGRYIMATVTEVDHPPIIGQKCALVSLSLQFGVADRGGEIAILVDIPWEQVEATAKKLAALDL